MTIKI